MIKYGLASSTWDSQEVHALHQVIESGHFTMGVEVEEFEAKFSAFTGSEHAVMVNSGSSANLALLSAARYRNNPILLPGDEVLVPAVSWSTTYYPVHQAGMVLKFIDIDPHTLNIDIVKVQESIGPKTRAILGVNLLGNCADWSSLRNIAEEHHLVLLEDNCESLGATLNGENAGTFGIGGTFSSFFSHHISTMEGGVIVTNDEPLFHAMRSIRAHGWTRDLPPKNHVYDKTGDKWDDLFRFVLPGYNLRPLEMEAAVGKIQLDKLPTFIARRRENSAKFQMLLESFEGLRIQRELGESSWFGFSLVLEGKLKGQRTKLVSALAHAGIESRPIVSGNFARNPVIAHLDHAPLDPLPVADEIHENGLFVGNHHYDLTVELELLANTLEEFSRRY